MSLLLKAKVWASAAAFGSWRRRWVYLGSRPSFMQVLLYNKAVSAAFILYSIFSIRRITVFSSAGRVERRDPMEGSATAGFLAVDPEGVLEDLVVVLSGTDVSTVRAVIIKVRA